MPLSRDMYFLIFIKIPANSYFSPIGNVPHADCSAHSALDYDISIVYSHNPDDSTEFLIDCTAGNTPVFSLSYVVAAHIFPSLPATDSISPGDAMQTGLTYSISTGSGTVIIKDFTKGGTFSKTMVETPMTGYSVIMEWQLYGGSSPLVFFYPSIKTTSDLLSFSGHSGTIGSFLSVRSVSITQYTDVNATGHADARATQISSTSSGFAIKWLIA